MAGLSLRPEPYSRELGVGCQTIEKVTVRSNDRLEGRRANGRSVRTNLKREIDQRHDDADPTKKIAQVSEIIECQIKQRTGVSSSCASYDYQSRIASAERWRATTVMIQWFYESEIISSRISRRCHGIFANRRIVRL